MQYIGYVLVIIHLFLLLWSSGGFLEMILPKTPWKPFTNPKFPTWLLMLHWGSILFASVSFLYGYFTQWGKTPQLMTVAYVIMALVCTVETFGFLTNKTKYFSMVGEYLVYIAILLLLYKSQYFKDFFVV